MDMLIGAHAKSVGATLVTNNEQEFRRIVGLHVENWTQPKRQCRRGAQSTSTAEPSFINPVFLDLFPERFSIDA